MRPKRSLELSSYMNTPLDPSRMKSVLLDRWSETVQQLFPFRAGLKGRYEDIPLRDIMSWCFDNFGCCMSRSAPFRENDRLYVKYADDGAWTFSNFCFHFKTETEALAFRIMFGQYIAAE